MTARVVIRQLWAHSKRAAKTLICKLVGSGVFRLTVDDSPKPSVVVEP